MNDLYGEKFFAQMAECREPYLRLGDCIADTLEYGFGKHAGAMQIADLGCGAGYVLERLADRGFSGWGYDLFGSHPHIVVHQVDLAVVHEWTQYDVVICTETAEHLPESASDALVENVTRAAVQGIVWSAAPPGQAAQDPSATGHINEQPAEYWLNKFAARGWVPDEDLTHYLRGAMLGTKAQHMYAVKSFYVLT